MYEQGGGKIGEPVAIDTIQNLPSAPIAAAPAAPPAAPATAVGSRSPGSNGRVAPVGNASPSANGRGAASSSSSKSPGSQRKPYQPPPPPATAFKPPSEFHPINSLNPYNRHVCSYSFVLLLAKSISSLT
jgi:hypothetical protein